MEGVGNDEDLVIYGDDGSMIMKGIEPRTSWSIVRSTKHSANLRTLHILNNLSLNNNKKTIFHNYMYHLQLCLPVTHLKINKFIMNHVNLCRLLLLFCCFFFCKMPGRGKIVW